MIGKRCEFVLADWRDAHAYAYTLRLTRLGWAWEFLRRNPQFRSDLARLFEDVERIDDYLSGTTCRSKKVLSRWGVLFR